MSNESNSVSRRSVLKTAAGTATAGAGAGLATAASRGDPPDGNGHRKYNVGFDAEPGRAAAREAASEVVREFDFDALTARLPEQAVEGLRNRPDVRYVEENDALSADVQTLPDGVDRIDADEVPSAVDGAGIDVAILDTGIDSDHPDLVTRLGLGAWVNEGCSSCPVGWGDDEGHGTSVAGIVGADDDTSHVVGVAPGVTLHAVQVCDTVDFCGWDEVAAGLEWVADQGYEVANMSLSGSHSGVVSDAVAYAADRDVLMVGSAGNEGPCTDCVNFPANEPEVLGISAWTRDGDIADYSNRGPEIDFTAPTNVETTERGGDTDQFGGTSAAAPHVAGTAAIARVLTGSRTEAESLLFDKAEDVGLTTDEQGAGMPDAEEVVVEPWVQPDGATPVDPNATLHGDLKQLGIGASSAEVYFEWGLSGNGLPNTTPKQTLSSSGSFSETVGPLACSTTYEFRPVAEASNGETDRGFPSPFFSHPCDDCTEDRICVNSEADDDSSS